MRDEQCHERACMAFIKISVSSSTEHVSLLWNSCLLSLADIYRTDSEFLILMKEGEQKKKIEIESNGNFSLSASLCILTKMEAKLKGSK